MSEVRLQAETRTEFGKGGARRTRRAGKVPAVIYGHGDEPRHISLPAREFTAAIRHGGANVLLTLDLDGAEQLVIPKSIQRHAIKGTYDHVDLLAVRRGEKITVDVPVVVHGDVVAGALLAQDATTVSVNAEATHVPSEITVDVTGREIGTQITAGQLDLPSGVELVTDAETLVIAISEAPTELDLEPEEGAAPAEAEAGEQASEDTLGEGEEATAETPAE
ncbi:MAG: 50S ribosomal protein L25/general stress protein Ctc [Jatrophihabitans sp.]|uniref:50S ribosomal protein L25/general stress protein Ctc n=1 Tax=Jatrophihabitans sp. TaxID=1932789 RepID=UPI003F823E73